MVRRAGRYVRYAPRRTVLVYGLYGSEPAAPLMSQWSLMKRDPYSPPSAPVADLATPVVTRRWARVHIIVASVILLIYARYFMNYAISTRIWGWLLPASAFVATAGFLLFRKRLVRLMVYVQALGYVGVWLFYAVPAFASSAHQSRSLLVDLLTLVPGIGLVVLPTLYCVYVARTYVY